MMKLRWTKTMNNKRYPIGPQWKDEDWLLVDEKNGVLARTYSNYYGPQSGRWIWALPAWGGHSGTADNFDQARIAVRARLEALGLAPTQDAH